MNLDELRKRVSAARAETEKRGETFYQGASRVHLAVQAALAGAAVTWLLTPGRGVGVVGGPAGTVLIVAAIAHLA